jgi:hypothetical protein
VPVEGETIDLPAGMRRTFTSAGDEEVRVVFELRPGASSTEPSYDVCFGFAREGRTITGWRSCRSSGGFGGWCPRAPLIAGAELAASREVRVSVPCRGALLLLAQAIRDEP